MPFLEETESFERANDELYRVVNGAQAAIDLATREVTAAIASAPKASKIAIRDQLFPNLYGRGISVDVIESFVERTVQENWRALAEFTIVNVVARFEWWIDEVVDHFPKANQKLTPPSGKSSKRAIDKALQFPADSSSGKDWYGGVLDAVAALTTGEDPELVQSVRPVLHRARGTSCSQLPKMLTIYRYFKEVRNALAHSQAVASDLVERWGAEAVGVTAAEVGLKTLPPVTVYTAGDAMTINMRTVALFDALVRRVVLTLDAELAASNVGASQVEERAKAFCSAKSALPSDLGKRERRLKRILSNIVSFDERTSGLQPTPSELASFEGFLRSHKIVS